MLKVHKKITQNEYLPDFKGAYAASALPPKSASEPHSCFIYIKPTAQSFLARLALEGAFKVQKAGLVKTST